MANTLPCNSALVAQLLPALEHSPAGICLLDLDGRCHYSNRTLRRLLHHTEGELPQDLFLQAPLGSLLKKNLAHLASGRQHAFPCRCFMVGISTIAFLQPNASVADEQRSVRLPGTGD